MTTEHKVIIDDYMTIVLKIPEEMTALELKNLTLKASKIFSLSEITVKKKYNKTVNTRTGFMKRKGNYGYWTPEMRDELMNTIGKGKREGRKVIDIMEELAKKFNLTFQQVKTKYGNVKQRGF